MQSPKAFDLTSKLLSSEVDFADRFVYSGYFVPLPLTFANTDVPILTYSQKLLFVPYLALQQLLDLPRPQNFPQLGEILQLNNMSQLINGIRAGLSTNVVDNPKGGPQETEVFDGIREVLARLEDLEGTLSAQVDDAGEALISLKAVQRQRDQILASTANLSARFGSRRGSISNAATAPDSPGSGFSRTHGFSAFPGGVVDAPLSDEQQLDIVLKLLQSQIGWLFLDRTRIRPSGYAVGEHIHSLSLAPGEELVVEQKTYSKRQTTYDEQTEQERQFDLELSSSLSTELQEGLDEQTNRNSSNGQGIGAITGFDVQLNLFDIVNLQKFKTTEASNDTRRRSVKDSQSATSKVAAKYRALHKIEFKVSREEGFERTSKRTLRNPNKYTPIQLHYFKVLHKMEMTQERYGARLCWTPSLQDPGRDVYRRLQQGRAAILRDA